jgi:very-short-patch-repair endonuclease
MDFKSPLGITPKPPRGGLKNRGKVFIMRELDKRMYFRAKPQIMESAKLLRKCMTESEKKLWERLKDKQVMGIRFRRQHPIDIFIADFYSHEAGLVIEVDGVIHESQKEYDDGREAEIERYNLKVLRFSNHEVENENEKVVERIKLTLLERINSRSV